MFRVLATWLVAMAAIELAFFDGQYTHAVRTIIIDFLH